MAIALIMAGAISLFASSNPDGLERVAEDIGFLETGEGHEAIEAPMPDYVIPGIENEVLSASLAGLIGTVIMFLLAIGLGKALKKREHET